MSTYSHDFMLISKITHITLKTIYSTSQLAPCSCTPEGKGRIFPKERRPSVLLTQSRTHVGPECLIYLIVPCFSPAAFGSRDKLCYHKLCSKHFRNLSACSSTVSFFLLAVSAAFNLNNHFVSIL